MRKPDSADIKSYSVSCVFSSLFQIFFLLEFQSDIIISQCSYELLMVTEFFFPVKKMFKTLFRLTKRYNGISKFTKDGRPGRSNMQPLSADNNVSAHCEATVVFEILCSKHFIHCDGVQCFFFIVINWRAKNRPLQIIPNIRFMEQHSSDSSSNYRRLRGKCKWAATSIKRIKFTNWTDVTSSTRAPLNMVRKTLKSLNRETGTDMQ